MLNTSVILLDGMVLYGRKFPNYVLPKTCQYYVLLTILVQFSNTLAIMLQVFVDNNLKPLNQNDSYVLRNDLNEFEVV